MSINRFHFASCGKYDLQSGANSFSCTMTDTEVNVQEMKDALSFIKLMDTPQNMFHFTFLEPRYTFSREVQQRVDGNAVGTEYFQLIEKLCVIQHKTGVRLTLKEFALKGETCRLIEEVFDIITTGEANIANSISQPTLRRNVIETALKALQTHQAFAYSTHGAETTSSLLDSDIILGEGDWEIIGIPQATENDLRTLLEQMEPEDTAAIDVLVLEGRAKFPRWKAES